MRTTTSPIPRATGTLTAHLTANRTPNTELTRVQRAAILSLLENGVSPSTIARDFQISRNTVYATRDRWNKHATIDSRSRAGRPCLLSVKTKRRICRVARQHPEWSMGEIMRDLDEGVSKSTVRKALMEEGLWTVGGNYTKMGRSEETVKRGRGRGKAKKNDVETSRCMPASEASVE